MVLAANPDCMKAFKIKTREDHILSLCNRFMPLREPFWVLLDCASDVPFSGSLRF